MSYVQLLDKHHYQKMHPKTAPVRYKIFPAFKMPSDMYGIVRIERTKDRDFISLRACFAFEFQQPYRRGLIDSLIKQKIDTKKGR